MSKTKILVVEDDKNLGELIKEGLESDGHEITLCNDGEEGLYYLSSGGYEVAVLDRMLPSLDGVSLLQKARGAGVTTPVILVTALGQINDRIDGLDAGADDYLVKPFEMSELLARIRALARRPRDISGGEELRFADVSLSSMTLLIKGPRGRCEISKKESELLETLLRNPEKPLSRAFIYARVWGADSFVEDSSLDIYIHYVRRHLAAVSDRVKIKTLRGVGYMLEDA
ncbi:MAG: response regulator transcription factor, partial [Ruminococcaceae bacterium]|nr:response regulator transcription factor [Oscillospiraceae bacterium]